MKKDSQKTAWYNPEIASDMVKGALCQLKGFNKLEDADHFPYLKDHLEKIPSPLKKLADVGCGAGEISRAFPNYDYIGFDLPHIVEEVALKVNPDSKYEKLDVVEAGSETIRNTFSSFDIVLCNSVISELENGESVLNSIFEASPNYIILHRQEIQPNPFLKENPATTQILENYTTYGGLPTIKCVLSENSIMKMQKLHNFSCVQAFPITRYSLSDGSVSYLMSLLFKKNETPQS